MGEELINVNRIETEIATNSDLVEDCKGDE